MTNHKKLIWRRCVSGPELPFFYIIFPCEPIEYAVCCLTNFRDHRGYERHLGSKENTLFFLGFCYCSSTFHTCDDLKSVMIYSAVQIRLPNAVSDIVSSHWRLFFVKEFFSELTRRWLCHNHFRYRYHRAIFVVIVIISLSLGYYYRYRYRYYHCVPTQNSVLYGTP